ncbi:MAG TPA: type II toxin-antitoxin system death-on-curing family toxin [Dermatophilaceae bacterium]|nr:type II toxin-antitoxin system death-on-curing family toxin [Dermatophilaceae bacterium]
MTDYLSTEDALSIAEELNFVVRDPGLLAGAIARPAASAFGADAYPGFDRKIAALIESNNRNHALVDGNKRLSWVCAVVFAHLNGWTLVADQEQINDVIRRVAESRTSLDHLTAWVGEHLTAY